MKRNLDLMREILLFVENSDQALLLDSDLSPLCANSVDLAYNIYLLVDAGFLAADEIPRLGPIADPLPSYRIYHLTSHGCDYLDSVRSQSVWEQTKNKLAENGTSATLHIISEIASRIILSLVESHLPR